MASAGKKDEHQHGVPINLAERRIASQAFGELFRQGMELVDEAAAYLDGDGRRESRTLARAALTAYAQQSMRLSTRLMHLASWLLLQRAVAEGDLSAQTAERERGRIDLKGPARETEPEALLPEPLRDLIARSYDLQRQIDQLDAALRPGADIATESLPNAVAGQIGRLRTAFERR
ncbi:DUF1465 family protein [Ancylobacter amanitiformis]|uniref:Regulator of CtrA degradation n=1 Tax=Ancylobacter amanitiformis TaxID=217069 RepID=A0ABU0LNN0_9HYPH|nr:DUF1465 family protein [Ancylobacter amanitiformis]MDQ0510311.1 regulator of CtrA degradation [Ancylobacter amanitiformis]